MSVQLEARPSVSPKSEITVRADSKAEIPPVLSLVDHGALIRLMIWRDFSTRYKGSLLGALWPFIHPMGHLLLYTFVFCIVLKVRFGSDASTSNFALYLMSGLLAWGAISEALARSTTCILEVPNLVKKVVFPLEVIPLVVSVSALLTQIGGTLILTLCACIYQKTVHASLLYLPVLMASQLLFTVGLCWLLSASGVYLRDLRHLMSLVLSAWMYTTPIVYPASALPKSLTFLLWINPVAGMVGDYRRVVLMGVAPDWASFACYTTIGLILFLAGYRFFMGAKRSFADVM